jgi:hypothetical protein
LPAENPVPLRYVAGEKVWQDEWRMCTGIISGGCVHEISVADVYRKYQWRMCRGKTDKEYREM